MATVYRVRKEQRPSGIRYVVDYRDNTGRRSTRRFKKARDAEAFRKQLEASTYTGLLPARPVPVTFGTWAQDWMAQKEALCKAGKKPRPSTLNSWRSDLKSPLSFFGAHRLHEITSEAVMAYVQQLQVRPVPKGRRSSGRTLGDKSIRNKVGLLSQILRSAKARRLIPLNPVADLDWKELLGQEEHYHRRHRNLPLTLTADHFGGGYRRRAHQSRTLGWFANQPEDGGASDVPHATRPHLTDWVQPVSARTANNPGSGACRHR
jgi:hypothetical protein